MSKLGRNDPCRCGSGKKYKKCCLSRDSLQPSDPLAFIDDLDRLSNSVVQAIRSGDLDHAEKLCKQLELQYPHEIDHMERHAMLHEARGDRQLAAQFYRQAAEHARNHEGFDPGIISEFLDRARRLS